ncbi:response regulator transcription factor [Ferrimonas aestuarii]
MLAQHPSESIRVLIVEDNTDISENIGDYLSQFDHIVDFADNGITAIGLLQEESFDVIVVDVMMPKMDGLTFCTTLRHELRLGTPVIMLTARDTLEDKLKGFHHGADDYLVKPFQLPELHVRIQALYQRRFGKIQPQLQVADLVLDRASKQVFRQGHPLHLNPISFKILAHLMSISPATASRRDLEILIWGDEPPDSDVLRTHLYKLRTVVDKPFDSQLLHTLPRVGYQLIEKPPA